ncbi:Thioredoxin [Clostridium sp. USBA 49]|jgi:thioredoxin-like negative regulator of GroEL|uniref:thioredoxin family protein n=1 Tax=Clostridium sp. USBA 49 TaxID=1881060 RepID=UPI00099A85B4|nr:thioredoxin family protein [Clostridium sp. USBA 49]SKA74050.1 Thioredoxin [Clostridium sp. USBA 49]
MNFINSKSDIEELINNNKIVLLYFGSNNCNVCTAMKPKVKEILEEFPKIKSVQIDVEKSLEISASYEIFTIPAILVFIEGKEIIREARYISIQNLREKIDRYYNMIFD